MSPIKITQSILSPAAAQKKVLSVPSVDQMQSEWCWAACSAMVLSYYGNLDVNKCDFVNWLFSQTKCCNDSNSNDCNKNCQWSDIVKIYSHWKIKCTKKEDNVSFSTIVSEINLGRPVEIGYNWLFGGGHVVLAIGYDASVLDRKYLYLNDPSRGHGWYLYDDVLNAGDKGSWVYTWTGIVEL